MVNQAENTFNPTANALAALRELIEATDVYMAQPCDRSGSSFEWGRAEARFRAARADATGETK